MKVDKKRLQAFRKDYKKLTDKHGFDFAATLVCKNDLTKWLVDKLGVAATMRIKDLK